MNACPAGAGSDKLIDKLHAELPADLTRASTRLRHRRQARLPVTPGEARFRLKSAPEFSGGCMYARLELCNA